MEKEIKKEANLESNSLIDKILMIQNLLNKSNSAKILFKETKDRIINNLYLKSKSYFEKKVKIKEVFDTNKLGEQMTYTLKDNPKESLTSYQSLYDFYFLIRNDSLLLLNIIELADKATYEELSYFLVHFLYENITNESYTENKLIIMIYLLLEKLIIKDLPDSIDEKNEKIPSTFLNETFIFYVSKNLTRKLDVRKFLYDILKSFILKMENHKQFLTVEISEANDKSKDGKALGKVQIVRKNALKPGEFDDEEFFEEKEDGKEKEKEYEKKIEGFKKRIKEESCDDPMAINTPIELGFKTQIITKKKKVLEELEDTDIDIYKFFKLFNITFEVLNNKLKKYESNTTKNNCDLAMIEHIKNLIKEFEILKDKTSESENDKDKNSDDKEIFSNSFIINQLNNRKLSSEKKSLIEKIKKNYFEIRKIINGMIENIKNNLISSPIYIKYLSKMILDLLNIKYNNDKKNKLSPYQLYKFELNFLIGNIIIPILKNPDFNGLISTDVISEYTRKNLNLITLILEKMIKGSLFKKNEDSYMTIFNRFIIDSTPKLFELVDIIEKQIETPDIIKNLLNDCTNNNSEKRKIDDDYFKEYPDEKIDYQNICFYNLISYYLSSIIIANKVIFIEKNQNIQQKSIIQKFIDNQNEYNEIFSNEIIDKNQNYFYITNILYSNEFNNKIIALEKDNFYRNNKLEEKSIIKTIKICLKKVFNYLISIKRLNLVDLIGDKIFGDSFKKDDLSSNLDFQKLIFPKIKKIISLEINKYNESSVSKQISFYINYLNLFLSNIPEQYLKNNYSLLFDELIHEIKDIIEYLSIDSLTDFHQKIQKAQEAEIIIQEYYSEIRNLLILKRVEYLYNKIKLPTEFSVTEHKEIIMLIEYKEKNKGDNEIKEMINKFPDFHKKEEEYDSILEIEKNANAQTAIFNLLESIKKVIKVDNDYKKFDKKEIKEALDKYIFKQLFNKIFPFEPSNVDFLLNKKCQRLSFLKPENVIEKNIISSNFLEKAIKIIKNIEKQVTLFDMINCINDCYEFLGKCNKFCFGKSCSGADEINSLLNYIIIKANPKNLNSIYEYCFLFLKDQRGNYAHKLVSFGMLVQAIKKSKYNTYYGISEKDYGIDEFDDEGNPAK